MVDARQSGVLAVWPDIDALFRNPISKQFSDFVSQLLQNHRDSVAKQCYVDTRASRIGNVIRRRVAAAVCAA
jgi:hypothetical protein